MDPLLESLVRDRPEALMAEGRPSWAIPLDVGRPSVNNPEVSMGRFAAPTKSAAVANTIRTGLEDTTDDKTFAGKAARLVAKLLWGTPREETTKPFDSPQAAISDALNVWNPAMGMVGMLAGKGAKGAPLDKLAKAMEAEAKGLPSQEIWRKYGWERGRDGAWRWEISDDAARLSPLAQEVLYKGTPIDRMPLGQVYEHPELYKAYPMLADLPTNVRRGERGGSFMPTMAEGGGEINAIARDPAMMLRVLTHEGQHGVQELEKFAVGGSPATVSQGEVALARSRPLSAEDLKDPAKTAYMRRAGEVEARNAEARLADSELRKFAPGVTEDVPRMLQTIRFLQENSDGLPEAQLAVKEKGGMWHPEAVERLTTAITGRARVNEALGLDRPEIKAYDAQVKRMVQNYLNKHAGTPTDPLKDVEVPALNGGVRRWEEITDQAIKSQNAYGFQGAKPGEKIHDIPGAEQDFGVKQSQAVGELRSYLSHVGDYLRQNVPAEKLQQYDLVRAVKETAANDARVAKEMEKAAAASTKDLPVYKEYPDGMRWVELKLPEKLAKEQAALIKGSMRSERTKDSDPLQPWVEYVAHDAQGKPIQNTYTGESARGNTPEEAYLAGQLAQEGNQMGHCVGGYCEGVAAGESRIFSLRDSKGRSHVTVEVDPRTRANFTSMQQETFPAALSEHPRILQIKGKQNRAPNPEYLPYVQDFVKSGKWEEVGDLRNTGLLRAPDGKYYTRREAQELRINPQLMRGYRAD